jgi:hypothetical protein
MVTCEWYLLLRSGVYHLLLYVACIHRCQAKVLGVRKFLSYFFKFPCRVRIMFDLPIRNMQFIYISISVFLFTSHRIIHYSFRIHSVVHTLSITLKVTTVIFLIRPTRNDHLKTISFVALIRNGKDNSTAFLFCDTLIFTLLSRKKML